MKIVHLGTTFERPSTTIRVLESLIAGTRFTGVGQLHQLISAHAHDQPAHVVEATEPDLARVIADIDTHDVAVFGAWMSLVTALAAPFPWHAFNYFLIASFAEAGWIGYIVLLYINDGCFQGEVVRRFAHA